MGISRVNKARPSKTAFNLSYRKAFTCDMGQLIPVLCDECVPGDHWTIGNEILVRFQPLVAPIMHEITVDTHYFFVPYRLLWEYWEDYITMGNLRSDGTPQYPLPKMDASVIGSQINNTNIGLGSLWDFLGFPVQERTNTQNFTSALVPTPVRFPFQAYNLVYNEYYRDQNLQNNVSLLNLKILNRNWRKDYFTCALPFQQKGYAPAFPVQVQMSMIPGVINGNLVTSGGPTGFAGRSVGIDWSAQTLPTSNATVNVGTPQVSDNIGVTGFAFETTSGNPNVSAKAVTFNVSDLRLAVQLQRFFERTARTGTRYTEFLRGVFGVSPRDDRLSRPEYIGGTKSPVIVSEVLQTSQTTSDSQLATMGGHGLSANGNFAGKYKVKEFGLIIGIMSVMPKPTYQDGINRQWMRTLPTDFYFPAFAHLSEQAIQGAEICHTLGTYPSYDNSIFGYTGQYDEMRVKHDMVCSELRQLQYSNTIATVNKQLSYWLMTRKFLWDALPALNTNFITCVPPKDIYLVPSRPGLVVNVSNLLKVSRPLPAIAEPGLIDHN